MLKLNEITICTNKEYAVDIESVVQDINTRGCENVYLKDGMIFDTITTRWSTKKVAALLQTKLYKSEVNIIGNIIFVEFK